MARIAVRGAREHNLQAVDVELERGSLVVICGRSGSGKSSFAFDTLHAEAQRRYVDVLALNSRGMDRGLRAPDVDAIEGLPPTVALSQRYRAPAPQATVGTWSDAWSVLSVLFGRAGTQHCPLCDRPIEPVAQDDIVRQLLALPEGTRLHVEAPLIGEPAAVLEEVERAGFSRVRVGGRVERLERVDVRRIEGEVRVVVDRLKVSADREDRLHDAVRLAARAGKGALVAVAGEDEELAFVDRPYCLHDDRTLPALEPRLFSLHGAGACSVCTATGRVGDGPCTSCHGSRMGGDAAAVRVAGERFDAVARLSLDQLAEWLAEVSADPVRTPILAALADRVDRLRRLGLHAPSLLRGCDTLSTGELQRLRLARQASAGLSGVLYVLDEPTAGLDGGSSDEVVGLLRSLVEGGNTVLAVSHHAGLVRAADQVIEFGPGAGTEGGRVVFDGLPADLPGADTPSGRWLAGTLPEPEVRVGAPVGEARFLGLAVGETTVDAVLPVGGLGVICGPSASGKTRTLAAVRAHLAARLDRKGEAPPAVRGLSGLDSFSRLVEVEASSARMQRSNPATYSGMWNTMRTLLGATREAQVRGLTASDFSLNQAGGRCEACKGTGELRVDLELLADVYLPCPSCDGRRFAGDALEVRWKGRNPSELLEMRVADALPFLAGHPKLERSLRALNDVGLGYVTLGQPAHTLSGGETQRLRLARELARASAAEGVVVLLDDPTLGLHPADGVQLVEVFRRFCDAGGTVWVASADPLLVGSADGILALG